MAYYDAFISAWNTGTLPASTTGTALTGLTTAQKLAAINGWTYTGAAATYSVVAAWQVLNCIQQADLAGLTADQKQQLGIVLGPGQVDPTPGKTAAAIFGNIFSGKTTTLNALVALQNSLKVTPSSPWWQFAGYPRPFDMGDVTTAGLS